MTLHVNVTIPTYNRECLIGRAIEAALKQTHTHTTVTVVDDGSSDGTASVLRSYLSEPRFGYVRLGTNVGTARAKNVSIALSKYDAITFHDSDDVPERNKVLLQARALEKRDIYGHLSMNWEPFDREAGDELAIEVVVGAYDLVKMDGTVHRIENRISLVDDFFPHLQFPNKTEGDWCLPNAGLYRRSVFEKLGGFMDCIEEDRELRNRTLAAGCIYYFIEQPLLTKIEEGDSLTVAEKTSFGGSLRAGDRDAVWARSKRYQSGLLGDRVSSEMKVVFGLEHVEVEEIGNSENFMLQSKIPMTDLTRRHLTTALGRFGSERAALRSSVGF